MGLTEADATMTHDSIGPVGRLSIALPLHIYGNRIGRMVNARLASILGMDFSTGILGECGMLDRSSTALGRPGQSA